ncbi:MAG TPA: hypothetical protein PLW14_11975 [Chlorobiota bacterium]|nr:hypothetical protein [Chlorobiota bacterium]
MKPLLPPTLVVFALVTPMLLSAQPLRKNAPQQNTQPSAQQQQGVPNLQAPPGYNMSVQKVITRYNFSKLTSIIRIPYDNVPFTKEEFPKGVKGAQAPTFLSKKAKALWEAIEKQFPGLVISRKQAQGLQGAGGPGTILVWELGQKPPADMRQRISRYLFGADEPKNNVSYTDEFLMTDNIIVMWSFKNKESPTKEAHQKKMFDMIGAIANSMPEFQEKTPKTSDAK